MGTPVGELLDSRTSESGLPLLAARVNNDICSLSYPLSVNSSVEFLAMDDPHGWRVYRRSLAFLLAKTVRQEFPEATLSLEHSFGPGLYCSLLIKPDAKNGASEDQVARIEAAMRKFVDADLPIERRKIAYSDGVQEFKDAGQEDKLNLLEYRNPPRVVIYWCDGFSDLAHGPLAPSTGVLDRFQLIPHPPGFVLQLPERDHPQDIPKFVNQPQLLRIFQEHKTWGRTVGVSTVGKLNEIIATEKIADFIRAAEALHEKKLSEIADQIVERGDRVQVILVAGPSCAGKTTFARRLAIHLMVNGRRPVPLSVDNYFVGKEENPVDEDGKPDYEHIQAVDIELLNRDLARLMDGQEVELPRYNFHVKQREYRGDTLQLESDQILLLEGIHGLNPDLTPGVSREQKFNIYVSALTQLSVDANNRISTTDNRLMRRLVRDHQYRGRSPLVTLQSWPSVRRGEKRWIFPYQILADATFNSALDYELAVLKPLVEPLLMQIKPCHKEFAESRRLTEFLLNFLGTSERHVSRTSILREYIGGSDFRY